MISPIHGLYAIIDQADPSDPSDLTPLNFTQKCLLGGARFFQLRQKKSTSVQREHWARAILELKKDFDFTFIVNDDPYLAKEVDADGVHLGQEDISVAQARKILGNDKIIGKSTHSWEEAKVALREPVDYIACGAVFPTSSKPAGHPVIGLDTLTKIVAVSSVPVVAIGGIKRDNVQKVLETKVSALALISALSGAKKITQEVQFFVKLFKKSS